MIPRNLFTIGVGCAAMLIASTAAADGEFFDVWLRPVDGTLVTGAITEGAPGRPIADHWRVFAAELGEDPQFPFSADEPGFQLLASKETINQVLRFTVTGPLLKWTGDGFASTDATMLIEFGPGSTVTGDGPVVGFEWSANDQGFIHDHFEHTLLGAGGNDPEPGIYLLSLSMEGMSPVLAPSLPFFYLFSLETDDKELDEAIEFTDLFIACALDINRDGIVDGADLGLLLASWGKVEFGDKADLNRDEVVDGADLGILLQNWGNPGIGDLDGNGTVDGADLGILLQHWTPARR